MDKKEKKNAAETLPMIISVVLMALIILLTGLNWPNLGFYSDPETTPTETKPQKQGSRNYGYIYTEEIRTIKDVQEQGIGTVEVSTLKLNRSIYIGQATFTFSGRVLITYQGGKGTTVATVNDDGSNLRELYSGNLGNYRIMPFKDNTRVLLGDAVLECPEGQNLDNCDEGTAVLIPIEYPEAYINDPNVTSKWTEIIISNDGQYIAWTMRRSDCGAANAMGRLVRYEDRYVIEDAKYISAMNIYEADPENEGCLRVNPLIGGEVKQFVRGGTAISLVGAGTNGMADSVIQDIATGEVLQITYNPGYDETTILSPDEQLGMVMTSRFSETTDLSVLGLVPRPYGDALHGLMAQMYMYSVTGVRSHREGNIGPALINISQSQTEIGYVGIDLSDPEGEWVYVSPMSWKNDGSKAMWIERQRNGGGIRIQIVKLLDYVSAQTVADAVTPEPGDYGTDAYLNQTVNGRVVGQVSGYAQIEKSTDDLGVTTIRVHYGNYSDDGELFYSGTEYYRGSMMTESEYLSDIIVTDPDGKQVGYMDVALYFSAAYSDGRISSPRLDLERSHGVTEWIDESADISTLVE